MGKTLGDFLTLIFKEIKYTGENDWSFSQQQNLWLKILCRRVKHFRWLSTGKKGSSSAFWIKTAWVWTMSFTNYNEKNYLYTLCGADWNWFIMEKRTHSKSYRAEFMPHAVICTSFNFFVHPLLPWRWSAFCPSWKEGGAVKMLQKSSEGNVVFKHWAMTVWKILSAFSSENCSLPTTKL